MTQQAELLSKINKLPPQYFREAIDFVGYLQQKAQQEANNTEPEQEAGERIVRLSIDSDGKLLLTKELIDEMIKNSPRTQALTGILSGMGGIDLDEMRMERLRKHI